MRDAVVCDLCVVPQHKHIISWVNNLQLEGALDYLPQELCWLSVALL